MGTKERRAREKESLRQEILDAARELFLKEGYANVTMRRIAEKIEYSPTTIYLYFKDKSELSASLCEEMFLKLARALEGISKTEADPVENLRRGMKAYIQFGLRYPDHYRLVFMSPDVHGESGVHLQFEGSAGERAFRCLVEGIQKAMEHGDLRKQDLMQAAQTAWVSMHGITSLLISKPEFPWIKKDVLIDSLVENTIRGMQK